MSPAIFEVGRRFLAVLLVGLAIKLMDDSLDIEEDQAFGKVNLVAAVFGPGATAYALVCLALAATLKADLVLPLFLASYLLGMGWNLRERLPSGLPTWGEGVVCLLVMYWFWGMHMTLFALASVGAVELLDDYLDSCRLQGAGCSAGRLTHSLGQMETLMLAVVLLLGSFLLQPTNSVIVLVTTLGLFLVEYWIGRRIGLCQKSSS